MIGQILPTAQRLLDELLSSQQAAINTVCGAPGNYFSRSMPSRLTQQSILAWLAMFSVVDLMNGFNERRCIVTNELLIVYLIIYMKLLRMWAVWFSVVDVQHLS